MSATMFSWTEDATKNLIVGVPNFNVKKMAN